MNNKNAKNETMKIVAAAKNKLTILFLQVVNNLNNSHPSSPLKKFLNNLNLVGRIKTTKDSHDNL